MVCRVKYTDQHDLAQWNAEKTDSNGPLVEKTILRIDLKQPSNNTETQVNTNCFSILIWGDVDCKSPDSTYTALCKLGAKGRCAYSH